jgi:hypothetical protein
LKVGDYQVKSMLLFSARARSHAAQCRRASVRSQRELKPARQCFRPINVSVKQTAALLQKMNASPGRHLNERVPLQGLGGMHLTYKHTPSLSLGHPFTSLGGKTIHSRCV